MPTFEMAPPWEYGKLALLVLALTVASGAADAHGFLYAASIWSDSTIAWASVLKSAVAFGLGISLYWLALRYMGQLGVTAPEIQTAVWFSVTVIGVALASGKVAEWHSTDRLVGAGVLAGIGWLLVRAPS